MVLDSCMYCRCRVSTLRIVEKDLKNSLVHIRGCPFYLGYSDGHYVMKCYQMCV